MLCEKRSWETGVIFINSPPKPLIAFAREYKVTFGGKGGPAPKFVSAGVYSATRTCLEFS